MSTEHDAANDPQSLPNRLRSLLADDLDPGERMPSQAEIEAEWRRDVIDRLTQADRRNAELVELQRRQTEALRGIAGSLKLLLLCAIVAVLAVVYIALR